MSATIDKVVITNLPSFYKINLYNELNKRCRLLVIYTGDHASGRNEDFYRGKMEFDYLWLRKSGIGRLGQLFRILGSTHYQELILGGWDSLPLWLGAFVSPKRKNSVVVESSYLESTTRGVKGLVKRLYMSRISKVYASGRAQQRLVEGLGYSRKVVITKGVGIFNYGTQPNYEERAEVKRFIYVGRLTAVKNLKFLIEVFNEIPQYELTIVGFGELEESLKSIARDNIRFTGAVENHKLKDVYRAHDVFILPSYSEPWGLVVEEALNNGLPVLVSDKVGCADEIIREGENGFIFPHNDKAALLNSIERICDITTYNAMRHNISQLDFKVIARKQVECYL